MTDRLSSYGYAFQIKVITALLVDKSFFEAEKILAKHDENYMPPEVNEALKENK